MKKENKGRERDMLKMGIRFFKKEKMKKKRENPQRREHVVPRKRREGNTGGVTSSWQFNIFMDEVERRGKRRGNGRACQLPKT